MPALALAAESAPALATQTTLTAETHDLAGRTRATVAVSVMGEDGQPASGAISIGDQGTPLAGAALDAQGQATVVLDLPAGAHSLTAVYAGDTTHRASRSLPALVHAQVSSTPSFAVSVAPTALTLTAGQSGTVITSVTPQNSSALTAPMFVTLSCSGLPDQAACTFTPENIEILPAATAPITSTMVITTQQASSVGAARPRRWLSRLSLLALVAFVATLGTTACNARYNYFNHGPPQNPATPAGTYTVTVTAQSSNGVTAITSPPTTTIALTVQ